MQKLGLNEIRERYLKFFESKAHLRLPSFPLIPQNDDSLLLIGAGMAPLKPYFTGRETPPNKRVTTCQKCIRTPDIERVGKTSRHGTFFEMLGNFSFGDYFKNEACLWAWEFVTKDLQIPIDKLWVSIYEEDDEAKDIWVNKVGVSADRIVKLGKDDNFWEIGQGPCGPCSEIYYDRGQEVGCGNADCAVGCDCDRFVEFWNLVFTQFDKDENDNYNPLANPNIDTGMGLERIACIMQGTDSLFEVDTVRNILDTVVGFKNAYEGNGTQSVDNAKIQNDEIVSVRIITDHIRSTVFMVCDGVLPSNEGRGYVLRRLLRRAARHGRLLGITEPFLFKAADTVIDNSKQAYPELNEKADYIKKVIKTEEERFNETIEQGMLILNGYISEMNLSQDVGTQKNDKSSKGVLDGERAFKLYDTYGFPLDLTKEILDEHNLGVDEVLFNEYMDKQRERARAARGKRDEAGWDEDALSDIPETEFTGYVELSCDATVVYASSEDDGNVEIILNATPFYAESGGQVGDRGILSGSSFKAIVLDTQKRSGRIIHICTMLYGEVNVGDNVRAEVDIKRRNAIIKNHTTAHLLQQSLRDVLGEHINQAGSMVSEDKVRFDFTHFSAMSYEEINKVEKSVNEAIMRNMKVNVSEMAIADARKLGAVALFGEKYGDTVRVVNTGDYSIELCGGCHVNATGEIGLFKIIGENGVAAGVRRIEGVTGLGVIQLMEEEEAVLSKVAEVLKTSKIDIINKASSLVEDLRCERAEIALLKKKIASGNMQHTGIEIGNITFLPVKAGDNIDMPTLRTLGDDLKSKYSDAVIILGSTVDKGINLVCMVTGDALTRGIKAGDIIREMTKVTGGGGGGKPESAQAGGKDASKFEEAVKKVEELIHTMEETRV